MVCSFDNVGICVWPGHYKDSNTTHFNNTSLFTTSSSSSSSHIPHADHLPAEWEWMLICAAKYEYQHHALQSLTGCASNESSRINWKCYSWYKIRSFLKKAKLREYVESIPSV